MPVYVYRKKKGVSRWELKRSFERKEMKEEGTTIYIDPGSLDDSVCGQIGFMDSPFQD